MLQGVKVAQDGWTALCPAHADQNPSLHVTLAGDGKVLVHCFAGCAVESVMEAIGLDMSALGADTAHAGTQDREPPSWKSLPEAVQFMARRVGGSIAATYEYATIDGVVTYAVGRFKLPSTKTFRPFHLSRDRWCVGDPQRLLPLFRLPQILTKPEVLVVEGEACVLQAEALGVPATTSAHGAKSAARTDWNPAAAKTVTIWPDNDDAGERYAADVVRILRGVNPDVRIRMIRVEGLPEGGDVSDWVTAQAAKGLAQEAIAAELHRLLTTATEACFAGSTSSTGPTPSFGVWAEPKPLPESTPPAPFPLGEAFPPLCANLRDFVAAVAQSYQVPVDLPALLAIAAFALSAAKCFEVVAQADWREVLSLYVLILLPSGERKSAVFAKLIDPIYSWQVVQASEMADDVNSHKNEMAVLKEKVRREKRKAAIAENEVDAASPLDELTRALVDLQRAMPKPPSLVASEATTESIADMLDENEERGMLAAPEGDAIDVLLGRYGQGRPNFGLWLNGHSGDAVVIRRKGRPPLSLRRPVLCVALTVQPVAVSELMQSPQAEGRGVLARFLYSFPSPMVGYREMEPPPVPIELSDWYGARLHSLLDRPVPTDPEYLRLTPEAKALLLAFREQTERDLRPDGQLCDRAAWGSKLPGAILRIAGILHLVGHKGLGDGFICAVTMQAALAWAPYLSDHERRATTLGREDAVVVVAKRILAWIQRRACTEFDHNQCFNGVRNAVVREAKDIDSALHLLTDLGWLRPFPASPRPPSTPGRPRSPKYEVNPCCGNSGQAPQNTHNAQNPISAASAKTPASSDDDVARRQTTDPAGPPPKPSSPCWACRGVLFWRSASGPWTCTRCYPAVRGLAVEEFEFPGGDA